MAHDADNPNQAPWRSTFAVNTVTALFLAGVIGAFQGSTVLTWLETLQFAGLFVLTLSIPLFGTQLSRVFGRAFVGLALLALAASTALAFYPPFHLLTAGKMADDMSYFARLVPIIAWVVVWRLIPRADSKAVPEEANRDASEQLLAFLARPGVRFHLFWVALFALLAMALLSGLPLHLALWPAAFVGALLIAFKSLLQLSSTGTLRICVLAASGLAALAGFSSYRELRSAGESAVRDTENRQSADAYKEYQKVLALTEALRTDGPRLAVEKSLALEFEKQNNPGSALAHWENVAKLSKADPAAFAPIRRVKCALGDSLPAWRMLVYDGFPAIANPEMAPGVMRLGEIAPDVRAKLLAALLAWNQDAPEAERRKWLDAVQAVSPGEPSSLNLLKRLGTPAKDARMWLPPELLVGTVPTYQSAAGTIEELGEVSTVVCLNAGHWEMSLRAMAASLHEEWPVVRVELNDKTVATTQIISTVEHDVPFTFEVKRDDIFKLRIVFQNKQDDLEFGHAARRGLKIFGIKFIHVKE